jgi:ELWxxDGT repeat protein
MIRQIVLFNGYDTYGNNELWITDGTAADTRELTGIIGAYGAGLSPSDLTIFNGQVLFSGYDTRGFNGLWVTNGTAAGTHEITGITGANQFGLFYTNYPYFNSPEFAVCNNVALFIGQDQSNTNLGSLWATDGTAAGTHEITGISGAFSGGLFNGGFNPDLTSFNGQVLFVGRDASGGYGLWVSDGAAAGTHELTSIANAGALVRSFTVFNNQVLFNGGDASLWVTDGTANGTHELTGISGASSSGIISAGGNELDTAVLNNEVLFDGVDTSGIVGLWVTNGTAAGTHEITGISGAFSGGLFALSSVSVFPPDFTPFNDEVMFDGTDAVGKQGLWVTDGTASGTHELVGISGASRYGIRPTKLTSSCWQGTECNSIN